ncbi:Fanconi anemia group D2 protein isoform X2 [Harpegnathos saltator]|uniref:Fanconi anemia group D2 protein isoform X2 n=1 Tax=Harpegnathos saltator TaxID=610380 RepID=UPI000948F747|nr:Fanconi anemia group D2 protein isoform X2 [Harpegnathos saltator]
MDKRKFTFKSLHNLQEKKVEKQTENIDSNINKQIDLHVNNITTQDGTNIFNDGQLSNTESVLKTLSNQSLVRCNSSIVNKKIDSYKDEKNLLGKDSLIIKDRLSKETSSLRNSQMLAKDIPSVTSQQNSDYLSRNMSIVNKSLTDTDLSVKKTVIYKRKIDSSSTDSENDFDFSPKKYIKKKKKLDEITVDTKIQCTGQNNINNSDRKLLSLSVSPIKQMDYISQKELQDKFNKFYSDTKFKRNVSNKESLSKKSNFYMSSVFVNFLRKSGIILSTDSVCTNVPPSIIKQRLKSILKQYSKRDIIDSIEEYIGDKGFLNILSNIEISIDDRDFTIVNSISVARILLEITEIQTDVFNIFISKLNEFILLADIPEKIPWAVPMLHQFRFLDTIASVDTLTANMEQLLETCPMWFQQELILFLPDILLDIQHQSIAKILTKIMEENYELTNIILNCITSFNLSKEYLMEYKVKVLNLLKTNIKLELIPIIIRFLLNDYVSSDIIKQMLLILRDIEMQPLADVTHIAIMVIKDINKDPKPLDLIILLLIFAGTVKQKNAESLWKQNIRCGFYRKSLLQMLYSSYKEVVQELQLSALQLAGKLLKSDEHVFVNFAIEWFRLQFLNQKEIFKQREIIEKIILFMGNNDQTVQHALIILCKMAENTAERNCLILQCNHLRILLEKIDCFGLQEVGTLSDLLHSLCLIDDSTSESLQDDLCILLQKQLSAAKPLTKCKGVMGAVMAIKHLARKVETCDQAMKLFNKVMKCVRNCSKSQPLFYDQLAQVIAQTEFINTEFLQKVSNCIEDEFVNTYMIDKPQCSEHLVPKFGLNNAEEEPQNCMLHLGNKRTGPIAPILFRLLKTCCMKLNVHGELEAIDALLGCGIFMPENIDIPEPLVLDLLICCINWFREIITGFVTQKDPLLQKQVLERLDTLIYLQGELDTLLTLCDTKYQPPPCYFHYFPLPLFVKIERKCSKKEKKSKKKTNSNTSTTVENELWKTGSTLCIKNPAYFRKFDAKIANLLDIKMDGGASSQHTIQTISIKQVCFVVRELLAIFENGPSELFMKELIHLLPKVCSKLDDIVVRLREDNDHNFREGARLLLCLLTTIFNWKGFVSVTYNTLLREGLRTLAGQINKENTHLRSCKELVAESYKYFESLSDIAVEISLAAALVNMCQSLMKHSETYVQQYKDKHAKLAYGFLCLEWAGSRHITSQYKLCIIQLLDNWMNNEPSPFHAVTLIMEWLPEEVSNLENIQNTLTTMPSINKNSFHLLYKRLFDSLIKGINISLLTANSDPKKIKIWYIVASNVQKLVQICKTLKTKANIQLFLRYMPQLIKQFLNLGMPILEHNLKYQTDDITSILKMMQGGTRYLHAICCDSTEKKDLILTKYVPAAKSMLEKLIYSVKGMLVLNDSAAAFWMGNLVNKNLDGHEILSQTSTEETTIPDESVISGELANGSSEIIDSDLGEDPTENVESENTDIDVA